MNSVDIIALEGIDGSGKTSLLEAVDNFYTDDIHGTREPTGYWTGDAVERAKGESANATFFAFLMDRAFHIDQLPDDKPIVMDRYLHSTIAYQQELIDASDTFRDELEYIEDALSLFPEPDCVIYIDLPAEVSAERTGVRDKYEKMEFLRSVRENYRQYIFNSYQGRTEILDGESELYINEDRAIDIVGEYVD